MFKKIVEWIVPLPCVICKIPTGTEFCEDCFRELPWLIQPCIRCANEIKTDFELRECGECMIDPPPFERNITLFSYGYPIDSLITKLKFRKQLCYAYSLGKLLARTVQERVHHDLPECLLPVPLHPARLRTRGYNQAVEIARSVKKILNVPLELTAIKRVKATPAQTLIDINQRQENVKDAFRVVKKFNYKHIAIIDDVITTFSTVTALALLLRAHGVQKIEVWCIAKGGSR